MDGERPHRVVRPTVTPGIRRVALGWDEPALPAAARWLGEHVGPEGLGAWRCITPGRRAGRRLLGALLAIHGDEASLEPPALLTPSTALDALLDVDEPCATEEECVWAWRHALAASSPASIAALVPHPPGPDDVAAWLGLARAFRTRVADVAASAVPVADMPARVAGLDRPDEAARWEVVARVATAAAARLADAGLVDPLDARARAIARGAWAQPAGPIALIGVAELKPQLRTVLGQSEIGAVTALVFAPEDRIDGFDAFGAVRPGAWEQATDLVRDEQLVIATTPTDQAARAIEALAALDPTTPPEAVTVGVADVEQLDVLRLALRGSGVEPHVAAGVPLARTGPYRFLAAWRDWMRSRRAIDLSTLLRHPDLERRGGSTGAARAAVDELMATRFLDGLATGDALDALEQGAPPPGDADLDGEARDRVRCAILARRVRRRLRWLDGLETGLRGEARVAGAWAPGILELLARIYGHLDADDPEDAVPVAACLRLREVLADLVRTPDALAPRVTAAGVLDIVLERLRAESVPDVVRTGQVELLGWLEVPLDPAPFLVLTGVREGALPESADGDLLLPDALRHAIGLPSNRTRLARDTHGLTLALRSRRGVVVIAPRQGFEGEPCRPSRLLLRVPDAELVSRVARLVIDEPEDARPRVLPGGDAPGLLARSEFELRYDQLHTMLPAMEPPVSMRVTEFRDYLACPFRYALQHRLRLDVRSDLELELDARGFGTLTHGILERFGRMTDARDIEDAGKLRAILHRLLDEAVRERYGRDLPPAVFVQIERMRQRLDALAEREAEERGKGWRIVHVERRCRDEVALDVPGGAPMPLRATIDRIDQNRSTGRWRILDYKTSDKGDGPEKTHRKGGAWTDLQLPLYHLIGRELLGLPEDAEVGYVLLPKKPADTGFSIAGWRRNHLDDAVACAVEVVRNVRAGIYEASPDFSSRYDDWERICQTSVLADESIVLEYVP